MYCEDIEEQYIMLDENKKEYTCYVSDLPTDTESRGTIIGKQKEIKFKTTNADFTNLIEKSYLC